MPDLATSTVRKAKLQVRIGRLLTADKATFFLVVIAALTEMLILGVQADSFRQTDWHTRLFGIVYITWFWITVGWFVTWSRHAVVRWTDGRSAVWRWSLYVAFTFSGATAALLYSISWGLFFQSGRLANFEAIRFVTSNAEQLVPYFREAEPAVLATAGLVVFAALLIVPLHMWSSRRTTWKVTADLVVESLSSKRFAAWLGLSLLTLACWNRIPAESSDLRRAVRREAVTNQMHPSLTLLISVYSTNSADIEPVLNENQLVGRRSFQWNGSQRKPVTTAASMPPSVIIVAIESLRHDMIFAEHQGQEILPNINRLARNGLHLTRAYAQSTHSDYADTCLVSSLYPLRTRAHHYFSENDPWPKTLIYDLLKPLGYSTAIISSQNEMWGGMAHFLQTPALDHFYHPETAKVDTSVFVMDPGFAREVKRGSLKAGKFPDSHTAASACDWLQRHLHAKKPVCLSMNLQSSHFPYLLPDDCERPFQPSALDPSYSFVWYPEEATPVVRNAYYNAIHECDKQVGKLVQTLEECGQLDDTILIVTGENGEAFHECGGSITHAREPVEPAIHIACVVHSPNLIKPQRSDYPFEHVDLAPTILGLLNLPPHPNFQGIDILAEDRVPADHRLLFCHVNTAFSQANAVVLGGRWKLVRQDGQGSALLFDVVADPNEEHNLLTQESELANRLQRILAEWKANQLAYYHFPNYYVNFFPPSPPRWHVESSSKDTDEESDLRAETRTISTRRN